MTPLNLSGKDLLKRIGLTQNRGILKELREKGLIKSSFKVGKKYFYPEEYADKINKLLTNNDISIKTDAGIYYVTINKKLDLVD